MLVVGLSLLAQGDSALVASTILLGPDRLLSQSTATLANTPECCGIQVLRNADGGWGGGGVRLSGKKRYECVMFNVINVTKGWVGVQFAEK